MDTHPFPVQAFIEAHHATVLVDEASFDANGQAIDAILAEKTGAVEREAFIEFVKAPCRSSEDVQAKLQYLFTGTVGERDSLLDCLAIYGDDLGERFLRSLLVEGVEVGSTPLPDAAPRATRACTCAREAA